jgi:hypothetical protein
MSLDEQRFVPNMEASLQAQGALLKAAAARLGLPRRPVLGYIDHNSPQLYFAAQQNASVAPLLARLAAGGGAPIDCLARGGPAAGRCCEQGTEFGIYNFSDPRAVAYYARVVIPALIGGPGLDGTFLDSVDWPLTYGCGEAPGAWRCTPGERAALTAGTLAALDAALASAAELGKLLCASSHTSLGVNGEYHRAFLSLLTARGNAWRFYEGFAVTADSMATLLFEAQGLLVSADGVARAADAPRHALPLMLHTGLRSSTRAPDWAELAAFLIAANEHSYFSASDGWDVDSFPAQPEFARPLGGAPLGPPAVAPRAGGGLEFTRAFPRARVNLTTTAAGGVLRATITWLP